ncbi:hypothetical protein VPH35_018878 [Triticum aestivum]
MPYLRVVVICRGIVPPIRPRLCAVYIYVHGQQQLVKVIVYLATRLADRQHGLFGCISLGLCCISPCNHMHHEWKAWGGAYLLHDFFCGIIQSLVLSVKVKGDNKLNGLH